MEEEKAASRGASENQENRQVRCSSEIDDDYSPVGRLENTPCTSQS